MSVPLSKPVKGRLAVARRHLPVVVLAGLLVVEVLVLTSRFDSQTLVDRGGWWGPLVGYLRYLPQGLMAGSAAALVLGGSRLREAIEATGDDGSSRGVWPVGLLVGHLAAFGVLAGLTQGVWEGPLSRSPYSAGWVAAWLASGIATLALGLAAVLPASAWGGVARRSSKVLLAALAVAVAACLAGSATSWLWGPLNAATFAVVRGTLSLFFADVVADPVTRVVGTGGFNVEIAPQCSGYEGIGLVWVFLGAYLWAYRDGMKFPRAFWLLPIGSVVIWLANAWRIVALLAIGSRVSRSVALGGFHSQAGWLAFNAVALGLVAVSRRWRFFAASAVETEVEADPASVSPTAAYLAPLLALVAAVMVSTALSRGTGFDALYPVRVLAVATALWVCRRGYVELHWAWSWPSVALGAFAFAVWMALEPTATGAASAELTSGLARLPRGLAGLWLAARVFGSVVTVPVAEELAFRGYLTRRLIAADFLAVAPGRFTWLSFLVSSCLFGALHGRFLAGVLAGAIYAASLYRKGQLSDAVLAHATTNALIAGYVLATGEWSLWV